MTVGEGSRLAPKGEVVDNDQPEVVGGLASIGQASHVWDCGRPCLGRPQSSLPQTDSIEGALGVDCGAPMLYNHVEVNRGPCNWRIEWNRPRGSTVRMLDRRPPGQPCPGGFCVYLDKACF